MGLDDQHFYTAHSVIARNGEEIHRWHWFSTERIAVEPGFRCDHAIIDEEEHEDRWVDEGPCGWCESQGKNGAWRPAMVVRCPMCDEVFLDAPNGGDDSFLDHITDGCWK